MTSQIRRANLADAEDCVKLIYVSGPHLFSYLFMQKELELYDVLVPAYEMDGTTFSKENIFVEEKRI